MSDSRRLIIIGERPTPEEAQVVIWDAVPLIAELLQIHDNMNSVGSARGHPARGRRPEEDEC